jgi:protein arginine kinase
MKHESGLPPSFLASKPFGKSEVWIASSFVLHRNIARYEFPGKIDDVGAKAMTPLVKNALLHLKELSKPTFVEANQLSPVDKEYLFEHFLFLEGFTGPGKEQGYVLDESALFLANLNIQDHLQLRLIDIAGRWDESWKKIFEIEKALAGELKFAFSPRFGYLTAEPAQCGTGFLVSVFLHLPALIHTNQLNAVLEECKEEGILATGMEGTLENPPGDLIVLSNQYTFGVTEETILRSVHQNGLKVDAAEKAARNRLKQEENLQIKDRITRAVALLLHPVQLEVKETLSALSLARLGIDLGIVTGISGEKLLQALMETRRAHLALHEEADLKEIEKKRAEYLQQHLSGMQLKA